MKALDWNSLSFVFVERSCLLSFCHEVAIFLDWSAYSYLKPFFPPQDSQYTGAKLRPGACLFIP
jgi:hypothetical protein